MGFTAAELKAIATLENTQFKTGVAEIEGALGKLATGSLAKVGAMVGAAFAVSAILNYGKALMQESARTERFAKTIGMSAGLLDELGDKAKEAGADAGGFEQKIVKMLDSQEKAISGDVKMIEAFGKLGVSMKDLTSMTPDQLLEAVAVGAQKDATAIHSLNQVMGRGAAGEYGTVLKDIAKNGLPQVSEAAAQASKEFSKLNALYESMKDKIGHGFQRAAVWVGKKLGLVDEEGVNADAQREEESRRVNNEARLLGLKAERAANLEKIKLEGKEKLDELDVKKKKAFDAITVSSPKAADSFSAMGRMVGGQYAGSGGVAERQLKELVEIAKNTEEQKKIGEDMAKKIAELGGE